MRKKKLTERLHSVWLGFRYYCYLKSQKRMNQVIGLNIEDLINLTTKQDQRISDLLRRVEVLEYQKMALVDRLDRMEVAYSEGMHSVSNMIENLSTGIDRLWDYVEKKNG